MSCSTSFKIFTNLAFMKVLYSFIVALCVTTFAFAFWGHKEGDYFKQTKNKKEQFVKNKSKVKAVGLKKFSSVANPNPVSAANFFVAGNTTITAVKTVDRSTAVAGDILTYTITINNTGTEDATGVSFIEQIDANTTLVPNSLKTTAVAFNDFYNSIGNVGISVPAANGVLANDLLGTPTATLTAITNGASVKGGLVNLNTDGSFTYAPAAGFTGNDTINYVLTNTIGTANGVVSIAVTNRIWFINSGVATSGANGTIAKPFNTIAAFQAINTGTANNAKVGDNIFIYSGSGNYSGPITLLNNQVLTGQGATQSLATISGITVPTYSVALPTTGGTSPALVSTSNGIVAGQGNAIRGFAIGNCTTNAISGSNFGTLTVNDLTINTSGQALSLATGTINGTIASLTSSGGANNVALSFLSGGSLSINGGALSGATGTAFMIGTAVAGSGGNGNFTYAGSITQNNAQQLVTVQGLTAGAATFSGNLTTNSGNGKGILVQNNSGGTITFSGALKTLTTTLNPAVNLLNNPGATISFTNGGLAINTTTGVGFSATGGAAAINITGSSNIISSARATALLLSSSTIGASGLTFQSISSGSSAAGTQPVTGISLNTTGSFGLTVTGTGTTAGSGGILQNITNRGIEIINASNVSFSNMNLNSANTADAGNVGVCDENNNIGCYGAVYLKDAAIVSLTNLNINATAEQGINANNVSALTIDKCTSINNGTVQGAQDFEESALKLRNLSGNCTISNSSFSLSQYRIAHLINNAGTMKLAITNSRFFDNQSSPLGQDCFEMRTQNAAIATVLITNSSFKKATTKGIQIFAESTSTINLALTGDSVDRQGTLMAGIEVGSDNTATMNVNVDNNPLITGAGEVALNVYADNSSITNATVRNNTNIESSATTNYAYPTARAYSGLNANSKVIFSGNTLKNTDQAAILITTTGGTSSTTAGRIDATIRSNSITTPNLPATNEAIEIRNGSGGATPLYNTNCANVVQNTVTVLGAGRAFRARNTTTGNVMRLQGNSAGPNTPVQNLWANNGNTNTGGTVISNAIAGSTLTFGTDATHTCLTPPNTTIPSIVAITPSSSNFAPGKSDSALAFTTTADTASADQMVAGLPEAEAEAATSGTTEIAGTASENTAQLITAGETVSIPAFTLPVSKTIKIQFQVSVNNPFPLNVCAVSNQGNISGSNFTAVLTDNDGTSANGVNPTVTTITAAPVFTTSQPNITATTDPNTCTSSQTFAAVAAGCPAPTVTYKLQGTSTVITSPYVFPAGVTTVAVTAVNGSGPDATSTFTVKITPPVPVVTKEPRDSAVCLTNPVGFSVTATGVSLTYQWQENTGSGFVNITNGGIYSGATTNSLGISSASSSMNGYQYRNIINACNSSSSDTTNIVLLSVNAVITGNTISGAQSVCSGSSPATLTGSLPSGGNGIYSYLWEKSTSSATTGFAAISNTNTQNYSPAPVTVVTWFRRVVLSGGCSNSSAAIQVSISPAGTWAGIVSSDWNTPSNWCGGIPTISTNVVIPSTAPNMPAITSGNQAANNIDIQSGAVLSLTSGNLTINGMVTGPGTIAGNSAATLVISGTSGGSAGTLKFASGNRNLNSLTVSRTGASAAVTIGSPLTIFNVLTVSNGTLNTGDSIILKSTVANTARVAPITGTGTISGNVIVERYIPSGRAWRLMTAPLSNSNTIREAWQNNGVYTPGVGTFITGPGGSGLDNSTGYSLKTYDTLTQQLLPVANTNQGLSSAATSAANIGYFLFVRGDREPANLTPPNTNVTTLTSKGRLQSGPQMFAARSLANNFTLIGNPYASPVDFSLLTRNNLIKRFYAWDPSLNAVGGYVLVDDADNDGTYSYSPVTTQTNILQSSQAFFVQTASLGAASITFNESNKSTVTNNSGFRIGNGTSEVFRTSLYLKNLDANILADGVLAEYNNNFSPLVKFEDGPKLENLNEILAIQRDGNSLSLERRPLVDANDTLFLSLKNTSTRNYQFKFEPLNFSSVVAAWLENSYLNTKTPISVTDPTTLDFSVIVNTGSANANRFRIVFKTSTTLTLGSATLKAYQQNGGIQVDWSIRKENNMNRYEVEKSADGHAFKKIGVVAATANNNADVSYNLFDKDPLAGDNFYRIKGVDKSGEIKYTSVVNVKIENGKAAIVVYPNPVVDRTISLQLNNQPKGIYSVQLLNGLGQQLILKTIAHPGGSATQTIRLDALVSKGVYQLHISNGDNKVTQQIVIQ